MIATVVNAVVVIVGSVIGVLFKNAINKRFTDLLMTGLALVVALLGISGALKTGDTIGMILCMVVGMLIGEGIDIERRLDSLGEALKRRVMKGREDASFTEGFVSASLLFCVGSMAIMGALEAGTKHEYTIILSKSIIDGIAAVSLSTAFGVGVAFSAVTVLGYQGLLTLCAGWITPYFSTAVINEMSAIGGLLLIGVSINMLNPDKHIKVANMLPAMLLPIVYQPLSAWVTSLF